MALTVQTMPPYHLTTGHYPHSSLPSQGNTVRRGSPVIVAIGAYKMAVVASAAALTLAAGGLALTDVASIMASFGGVLVSTVTLSLMARKAYKTRRRHPPPPPVAPMPPPGLPLGRATTKAEYAQALAAQLAYADQYQKYTVELEVYWRKHHDGGGQ